jgi:predicted HTH domain antitoxin
MAATEYSIEIPPEVIHSTRMSTQDMKRELALTLFQQGKLSFGKAREMADMNVWEFQLLLGSRGIIIHYEIQDYLEDQPAIDSLIKHEGSQ